MSKIFILLLITILLFCSLDVLAQTDSANKYQTAWLNNFFKNLELFFVKTFVYLIEVGKKAITFIRDRIFQDTVSWLKGRRAAIQEGIGEEKQELKEGVFQYLKNFWERIKNIFSFSEKYHSYSRVFMHAGLP
ncbi:MAG: hypothetical protein PHN39_03080 [Candidatus Pacebacteria bacterium]|nr:hypothetical protein [Candidatus Paceibacterota bacterium]